MIKDRPCKRCKSVTQQEICCRINADKSEAFGWWCKECRWWNNPDIPEQNGYWIEKSLLQQYIPDLSVCRVVEDLTQPRCARCKTRGAQLHHWGPVHLFGAADAETWPKDYLCPDCHKLWHDKVTPDMSKGGGNGAF